HPYPARSRYEGSYCLPVSDRLPLPSVRHASTLQPMKTPSYCTKPAVCPYCDQLIAIGERIAFVSRSVPVHQSISGRCVGERKIWRAKHWDDRVCVRFQRDAEKARFDAETEDCVASV